MLNLIVMRLSDYEQNFLKELTDVAVESKENIDDLILEK